MPAQHIASRRTRAAEVERTIAGRGIVFEQDANVVPLNPGFFRLLRIQQALKGERLEESHE